MIYEWRNKISVNHSRIREGYLTAIERNENSVKDTSPDLNHGNADSLLVDIYSAPTFMVFHNVSQANRTITITYPGGHEVFTRIGLMALGLRLQNIPPRYYYMTGRVATWESSLRR